MVCKFFYKKTSSGIVKTEKISNKELAEELHKPIIRKFKKRQVHSTFINNIFNFDMQLIRNLIKDFVFYYALLIFSVNTHGLFL